MCDNWDVAIHYDGNRVEFTQAARDVFLDRVFWTAARLEPIPWIDLHNAAAVPDHRNLGLFQEPLHRWSTIRMHQPFVVLIDPGVGRENFLGLQILLERAAV